MTSPGTKSSHPRPPQSLNPSSGGERDAPTCCRGAADREQWAFAAAAASIIDKINLREGERVERMAKEKFAFEREQAKLARRDQLREQLKNQEQETVARKKTERVAVSAIMQELQERDEDPSEWREFNGGKADAAKHAEDMRVASEKAEERIKQELEHREG